MHDHIIDGQAWRMTPVLQNHAKLSLCSVSASQLLLNANTTTRVALRWCTTDKGTCWSVTLRLHGNSSQVFCWHTLAKMAVKCLATAAAGSYKYDQNRDDAMMAIVRYAQRTTEQHCRLRKSDFRSAYSCTSPATLRYVTLRYTETPATVTDRTEAFLACRDHTLATRWPQNFDFSTALLAHSGS